MLPRAERECRGLCRAGKRCQGAEQRIDLRRRDHRGRGVLRTVLRVYQRDQSPGLRGTQARVQAHTGKERSGYRRQRDDRMRGYPGGVQFCRGGERGHPGRTCLRDGLRKPCKNTGLGLRLRSKAGR